MSLGGLSIVTRAIFGFLLGSGVSFFNYAISEPALRSWIDSGAPKSPTGFGIPRGVVVRYLLRYGTNFLALFAAYALDGEPVVLLLTAVGLLTMRNIMLVSYLLRGREG